MLSPKRSDDLRVIEDSREGGLEVAAQLKIVERQLIEDHPSEQSDRGALENYFKEHSANGKLRFFNLEPSKQALFAEEKGFHNHPYPSFFSLRYYIESNPRLADLLHRPELCKTFTELPELKRIENELPNILNDLIPPISYEYQSIAITLPMNMIPVTATELFATRFMDTRGAICSKVNLNSEKLYRFKVRISAMVILKQLYQVEISYRSRDIIFEVFDTETDSTRFHKLDVDPRFFRARMRDGAQRLTPEQINKVLADQDNSELLLELLNPKDYWLEGFIFLKTFDITSQVLQAQLQKTLINESQNFSEESVFRETCKTLRGILEVRKLCFSVTMIFEEQYLTLKESANQMIGCIVGDSDHFNKSDYQGSFFERADAAGEYLLCHKNDATIDDKNPINSYLIKQEARAFVICPLRDAQRTIGYLGIFPESEKDLQLVNTYALSNTLPLLSLAAQKTVNGINQRIDKSIKEYCTAIHPAVEWRFADAAFSYEFGLTEIMEPIKFENVYPLFAVSDIRGSSHQRNSAVHSDLSGQLECVAAILQEAFEATQFPIFDELFMRTKQIYTEISERMNTGAETTILNFLRDTVHPTVELARGVSQKVDELIQSYINRLDERHHCFSERRREFETSVLQLNQVLSRNLQERQAFAQASCPHYFEIHATDGVEHGIYVGQSMLKSGNFSPLQLENLRLWQLVTLCEGARLAERLRHHLPCNLEVTHLVVSHESPITLVFDYEQKQFDIEGAYSVRYEIMKKRIDKATIKFPESERGKRITQPMQLAVIYSQESERLCYMRYFNYLSSKGYLSGPVEFFELEDLQGITGLLAMRCSIANAAPES